MLWMVLDGVGGRCSWFGLGLGLGLTLESGVFKLHSTQVLAD